MTKIKLPVAVVKIAKSIINTTADGSVGYDDAVALVSDRWSELEEAGAVVGNLDEICAYVKWAKCEGFNTLNPLK